MSQVSFTYDGLDRVASRNTDTFTYAGMWLDPTTDGAFTYSRTPAGRLVAQTDGVDDWLFGQDRHGDVTALINPATAAVTDTRLYDPFGDVAAQTGTTNPTLGFQGDYTDPASDEVWMGARWYSGADAVFRSRDSVFGELAMPISLNRYTYAGANPLRYWDPDGRYLVEGTGGSDEVIPGGSTNPTYQNQGWAKERAQRRASALDAARIRTEQLDALMEDFYIGQLAPSVDEPAQASSWTDRLLLGVIAVGDDNIVWEAIKNSRSFIAGNAAHKIIQAHTVARLPGTWWPEVYTSRNHRVDLFRPNIAGIIEIKPANDVEGAAAKAQRAARDYDPSVSRLCKLVYCNDFAHLYPTESEGQPSADAWAMEGRFDSGVGFALEWWMPEDGVIAYEWVGGEGAPITIPNSKLKDLKWQADDLYDSVMSDSVVSGSLNVPVEVPNLAAFVQDLTLTQAEIQGVVKDLAPFAVMAGGAAAAFSMRAGGAPR